MKKVIFLLFLSISSIAFLSAAELKEKIKNGESIQINGKTYRFDENVVLKESFTRDQNNSSKGISSQLSLSNSSNSSQTEISRRTLYNPEKDRVGILSEKLLIKYKDFEQLSSLLAANNLKLVKNYAWMKLASVQSEKRLSISDLATLQHSLEQNENVKKVTIEVVEDFVEAR